VQVRAERKPHEVEPGEQSPQNEREIATVRIQRPDRPLALAPQLRQIRQQVSAQEKDDLPFSAAGGTPEEPADSS